MGGYGSGRAGWRPKIENGLKLDLADLRRKGLFAPDDDERWISLSWSYSTGEYRASLTLGYSTRIDNSWLRLKYQHTPYGYDEPISVDERFALVAQPQPFGGVRWFIVCPQCQTLCRCLYLPPGATRFRSRQGFRSRLAYLSQSGSAYDRMLRRRDRLAVKVLRAGPRDFREKYSDWDFPPKPPWMRWATYNRQFEQWEDLEIKIDRYLTPFLAKFLRS